MTIDAENAVLERLGLDYELLDSGCCGMAGLVRLRGREHYDVSVAVGEHAPAAGRPRGGRGHAGHRRRLQLPRADRRLTDREALHLAQVIQMALRGAARSGHRADAMSVA